MSFAATLGLVALVQVGMPRLFATPDSSAAAKVALWGGREMMTLVLASFVAGLATTPYAAFHFHRVTPYGVLANLAAMPVVSALVMPAGMLGLLAMPFGFDGFFWWLMGIGIDWMIVVTQGVAALPGAIGRMAAFGVGPLIAASIGIVPMGLLRTPLRWSGAAVLALAVAWALMVPQPDILISGDGHNVNRLRHTLRSSDVVARLGGGRVSQALRPDALTDDCERATLIVTPRQPPPDCAAAAIDQDRSRRQGVLALRRNGQGFAVEAVKPKGVDRPWSPAPAGEAVADTSFISRPAAPRAQDATPSESDLQSED